MQASRYPEHFNVRDTGFVKRLATRHKTETPVKPFGIALRVQHDFGVTALPGGVQQSVKNLLPDT